MEIRKLRENDYDMVSQFMAQLHNLHAERQLDLYRQLEEIGTVYTKEEFFGMLQDDEMITLGAESAEGDLMESVSPHPAVEASDHGAEKNSVYRRYLCVGAI